MCEPIQSADFLYEYPSDEPTTVACPQCQRAVYFSRPEHVGQKCRCGFFVEVAWALGRPRLAHPITAVVVAPKVQPAQAQVGWVVVDTAPRLSAPNAAPNAAPQLPEPERYPLPAWLTDSDRAAISDIRRMADALKAARR